MSAKNLSAIRIALILLLFSLLICSCGTPQFRTTLPPRPGEIAVNAKYFDPGEMRPVGSYVIKDTSYIIGKGAEYDEETAAFMFGAFGGLLAGVAADLNGKEFAKNIIAEHRPIFKYDLVGEIEAIVKAEIKAHKGLTQLNGNLPLEGNDVMEFEPWVYVEHDEGGKIGNIRVYLRTFLKDKQGKIVWRGGYNYQSPVSRLFEGTDGWFANGGQRLKETVRQGYQEAVKVMLQDLKGASAGWNSEQARFKGYAPGGTLPFELDVTILKQEDGMILYTPKTTEMSCLYGVNIVPRNFIVNMSQAAKHQLEAKGTHLEQKEGLAAETQRQEAVKKEQANPEEIKVQQAEQGNREQTITAAMPSKAIAAEPRSNSQIESGSRFTLAVLPWKFITPPVSSYSDDFFMSIALEALGDTIKKTALSIPLYSYYPLDKKFNTKPVDASILGKYPMNQLWMKKGMFSDPEPNTQLMVDIGRQLNVDAVLVYYIMIDTGPDDLKAYLVDVNKNQVYRSVAYCTDFKNSEGYTGVSEMTKKVFYQF